MATKPERKPAFEPVAAAPDPVAARAFVHGRANGTPETLPEDEALFPQTFRFPKGLIDALARQAFTNKMARRKPDTRQDVLTIALREYLERNPLG